MLGFLCFNAGVEAGQRVGLLDGGAQRARAERCPAHSVGQIGVGAVAAEVSPQRRVEVLGAVGHVDVRVFLVYDDRRGGVDLGMGAGPW